MALLLLVVVVLKRRLAGGGKAPVAPDRSWEGLALHYGAEDVLASQVFEKMGGKVGRGYAGVGGDERGLLLYHPGHKGARIPWSEITLVPGSFMGLPAFRIETEKTSDITIIIPRRYEERLRAKAGASWPVPSSRTAADEPGVEE
ncbi:MAG TPA: hypothetical protein VIU29_02665 [Candidatus Deferrimicrobiaceae bacterium]